MKFQAPIDANIGAYFGSGENEVRQVRWQETGELILINDKQGFERVRRQVWEFEIGSYAPLSKYLRARQGRHLSLDEIEHVERIIRVIESTLSTMEEIDEAYRTAFPHAGELDGEAAEGGAAA